MVNGNDGVKRMASAYFQLNVEGAQPCGFQEEALSYNEGEAVMKNAVGRKVAGSNPGAGKFFSLNLC